LTERRVLRPGDVLIVKPDNFNADGNIVKGGLPVPHASARMGGDFFAVNDSIYFSGGRNKIVRFPELMNLAKRTVQSAFCRMQNDVLGFRTQRTFFIQRAVHVANVQSMNVRRQKHNRKNNDDERY